MNLGTAKMALGVAKKAYGSYADYRDRKAVEAYEALLDAANNYDLKARLDDSTQRFNTLSEKALKRFDDIRAEIDFDRAASAATTKLADLSETAQAKTAELKKRQKQKIKAAQKQAKKKSSKKTGKKALTFGAVAVFTAIIGGAAYYFLGQGDKKKKYGTVPPAVEDYEGSRLVYSTATGAEEPAVRDEELLNSLEEQLAAHEAEQLAAEAKSEEELTAETKAEEEAKAAEKIELDLEKDGKN